MVKNKSDLLQDRMGHETEADYFPVLQQTMEDKTRKNYWQVKKKSYF